MKYLYYLLGYFPHFLVILTYIYCLISVYKSNKRHKSRSLYLSYFVIAAVSTILSIFLDKTNSFICAFLFISFDFLFFLYRGHVFRRNSLFIIIIIFCANFILSKYLTLNRLLSIYSICINFLILLILFIQYKLKKYNYNDEDVFWFNSSYSFYAFSTISCDLILSIGGFGERTWTYLFIYFIIYNIWIAKSFILLKSYKCKSNTDL